MLTPEDWRAMREKYREGVSISQIAREHGVARKTARKYAQSPTPPPRRKREPRGSKIDPYKPYITERLETAVWERGMTAKQLFDEIREQGYTGGYTLVKSYVQKVNRDRKAR